jgi:hypothetical protein
MIFLNFLGEKQNRIFNELYELTDGKIILTGSSVLKYHNIIDRNVGNLNVFINKVDLNYFEKIKDYSTMDYVGKQPFNNDSEVYWFKKYGINNVFFINDDMSFNEHDINGVKVRINKPENIKEIKNALLTDQDSHSIKHYKDIEKIIVSGGVTLNKTLI